MLMTLMSRTLTTYKGNELCYSTIRGILSCSWEKHLSIIIHANNKRILTRKQNIHSESCLPYYDKEYSVLKASCLQSRLKNWQDLRKNKLTASTFALAVGFWPRKRVKLWLEKIGAIEPFPGNMSTSYSNVKEEEALERYKSLTHYSVIFPKFQVLDDKYDWLGASPDGVVDNHHVYNLASRGVLEIKCPYFGGNARNSLPWKRVPFHRIPQAQGLMAILDKDWLDLYVWTPNGSSLFRMDRDVEYWNTLHCALHDFWWNHVQPAKEEYNKSVITKPTTQLSHLKPEDKHELCEDIIFKSRHLVDKSRLLFREIHGRIQNY